MTQQEIKDSISKGEWHCDYYPKEGMHSVGLHPIDEENYNSICGIWDTRLKSATESAANAAAIVSAVNNTYGQGIDPTKVPAMALQLDHLQKLFAHLIRFIPTGDMKNIVYDANIETLQLIQDTQLK